MEIAPRMILRNLEGGLVLRTGCTEDAEALSEFNGLIHSETDQPDAAIRSWTRDLLTRPHPTLRPQDFTVVEEVSTGKIVSSCNLIPQTWCYAGIPFAVGRPELVGTHPDYRNRGLVRAQFEVLHTWCRERGMNVQAITGIPFYYRQFGYEMTVRLEGWQVGWEGIIPKLKEGESEPYLFRPAREEDIAWITELYTRGCQRYLLSAQWDERLFQYQLNGTSVDSVTHSHMVVIETSGGQRAGFLIHPSFAFNAGMLANWFEMEEGHAWRKVVAPALRYLLKVGKEFAAAKQKECTHAGFMLSESHPALQAAREWLPTARRPYAYYMRVDDLHGFLRLVAPILEKRLSQSVCSGYDGKFKINFYRKGTELTFQGGRLTDIQSYIPKGWDDGQAAFPEQTFLHLLFGHRSLDDLQRIFPDCRAKEEARLLLEVLFPTQASDILSIS